MINRKKIEGFFSNINEKIDDFLDYFNPIYRRISANYLGLIGVLVASMSIIIAFLLYIAVDPSFTPFTHWISHLGIGPNGANLVFNIGILISSIFIFFFFVQHVKEFRKRKKNKFLVNLLLVSVIATCSGLAFVAIFPYNIYPLHGIAANTFFLGGGLSCFLYSILVIVTPHISKIQAFFGFITVAMFAFHIVNTIRGIVPSNSQVSEFDADLTKFSEWLVLFSILSLLSENIVYNVSHKNRFRKRAREFLIDSNYLNTDNIYKLRKYVQLLRN